jgi:two-component system, OmpR family, sensor histidine kinase VicK
MTNRERVLYDIARQDRSDVRASLRAVTEGAAHALDVARVGIWRVMPDQELIAVDVFARDTGLHDHGATVRGCPCYLAALSENRTIAAHDAFTDPRTAELVEAYLRPLGITSMLDVPIWYAAEPGWVLCHEHVGAPRRWTEGEQQFAAHLADLVALSLEAGERRAGERRWLAVLDAIDEAVFVLNPEGCVAAANRSGKGLLEFAGGGRTLTERQDLVEFRDAAGRHLSAEQATAIASGQALNGEVVEAILKRAGERRVFRVTSAPIDADEHDGKAVVVMADISDEANLERLKSEVLSALAHELNTPLAVAKGYAQHLAGAADTPPGHAKKLSAIVRAADRMERLTADLVELSRITLGRIVLSREPSDVGALVRRVIACEKPKVALRITLFEAEPVMALLDAERVSQAVRRLIDNALRFAPDGSPVEVSVESDDGDALVKVRDSGIGIPPADRLRIFDPFVRAHAGTAWDYGGLGVGLFLAREIALRHGGSLDFTSSEGSGSEFTLRLPRMETP